MNPHTKQLLTNAEVNIHVITGSPDEAIAKVRRMNLPEHIKQHLIENIAIQPGLSLNLPTPLPDGSVRRDAYIYTNADAYYKVEPQCYALMGKHEELFKSYIKHHEIGHSRDPNIWKEGHPSLFGAPDEDMKAQHEIQQGLRGEQVADIYGVLHMLAEHRPSLEVAEDFLERLIDLRHIGESPIHQTTSLLQSLRPHLPELHEAIVENDNTGSRHAQANAYVEQLVLGRLPDINETVAAGKAALNNHNEKQRTGRVTPRRPRAYQAMVNEAAQYRQQRRQALSPVQNSAQSRAPRRPQTSTQNSAPRPGYRPQPHTSARPSTVQDRVQVAIDILEQIFPGLGGIATGGNVSIGKGNIFRGGSILSGGTIIIPMLAGQAVRPRFKAPQVFSQPKAA